MRPACPPPPPPPPAAAATAAAALPAAPRAVSSAAAAAHALEAHAAAAGAAAADPLAAAAAGTAADASDAGRDHTRHTPEPAPAASARAPFPLPAIFKSSAGSVEHLLVDYPWLLSTAPPREAWPTLWQVLKQKNFLKVATKRAMAHLKHPTYDFPSQFLADAGGVTRAFFAALSDPATARSSDALQPLMVRGLARLFADGHASLAAKRHRPSFVLHSPPKLRLKSIHLTYGPYPSPPDYVAQDWFEFIRLVVPVEDSDFESHPRQREVLKQAEDDGVYMRITTSIDCDLEFTLTDEESGIPLVRDRRDRVDLQFISPHFTPWDDLFYTDESGEQRLGWPWRISDVDSLMANREAELDAMRAKQAADGAKAGPAMPGARGDGGNQE
ncbi:hypothetical protein HK105_207395 [Polyrhizophydium stewartii]|uniref:Uncharacterized protein n=1 Tax=Polyrhizophydium stewartii TaxID=2732419 RepID=A0ABR4N0X5_9FUNG